jgi:hypothetical protein
MLGFTLGGISNSGIGFISDNISRNTGRAAVDCDTMKIVPTREDFNERERGVRGESEGKFKNLHLYLFAASNGSNFSQRSPRTPRLKGSLFGVRPAFLDILLFLY